MQTLIALCTANRQQCIYAPWEILHTMLLHFMLWYPFLHTLEVVRVRRHAIVFHMSIVILQSADQCPDLTAYCSEGRFAQQTSLQHARVAQAFACCRVRRHLGGGGGGGEGRGLGFWGVAKCTNLMCPCADSDSICGSVDTCLHHRIHWYACKYQAYCTWADADKAKAADHKTPNVGTKD